MIDLGGSPHKPNDVDYGIGGCLISETIYLASNLETVRLGEAEFVGRAKAATLLASAYPVFYAIASPGTSAAYMTSRTVTGIAIVTGMGFDGVSTVIATGKLGEISRSVNSGSSFVAVSSPVTGKPLGNPVYLSGRWIIPYDDGSLVSTDGGASFTKLPTENCIGVTAAGKTVVGLNAIMHAPAGDENKLLRLDDSGNSWSTVQLNVKNLHPGNVEIDRDGHVFLYTGMYHQDQKNYAYAMHSTDGVKFSQGSLFVVNSNWTHSYIRWIGFGWARPSAGETSYEAVGIAYARTPNGNVMKKRMDRSGTGAPPIAYIDEYEGSPSVSLGTPGEYIYRNIDEFESWMNSSAQIGSELTMRNYPATVIKSRGAIFEILTGNTVKMRVSNTPPEITLPSMAGAIANHQYFTRIK